MTAWQIKEIDTTNFKFKDELQELWLQDKFSNPFNSPSFLEVMARTTLLKNEKVLLVQGFSDNGKLFAIWPLRLDRAGILHFLPYAHNDQCTCVYLPEVAPEELGNGFAYALRQLKPFSVSLKNIPPWGHTLKGAINGLEQAGWHNRAFAATSCPVLTVEPGPGVEERLRKQIMHKTIKKYENRLKRQPGCCFELFEGPEELEEWTAGFCDTHEWQWNRTVTPSKYCSLEARTLFADILKAWSNDNLLVRFSIRLAAGPIAFMVCLASKGRLIHHHGARSPAFKEFRVGHVMIRHIGLWMLDNGFNVLDFGVGSEGYKFRYANNDEKLWRLYGARRAISPSFGHGWIEERIRKSDKLQKLWDELAIRWIREKLCHLLRTIRKRVLITKKVHYDSKTGNFIAALKSRFICKREILYRAYGSSEPKNPQVVELKTFDVLEMLEKTTGLFASSRAAIIEYRYNGGRPFGIIENGQVMHASWLKKALPEEIPEWMQAEDKTVWWIQRSVTAKTARRRGLYTQVLKALLKIVPEKDIVLGYADTWNKASQHGIEKAGFKPFALRVIWRGCSKGKFEKLL